MTEIGEAVEGIVALIVGGYFVILIGSSLKSTGTVNLTSWGVLFILVGFVLAIALVAGVLGELVGRR